MEYGIPIICVLLLLCGTIHAQDQKKSPPAIIVQDVLEKPYRTEDDVEIKCVATGNPTPDYSWYKDGQYLQIGQDQRMLLVGDEGSLVIRNPVDKDQGFYQCNATNTYGTALSVKTLLRLAVLGNFQLKPTSVHRPQLGSPLKLLCIPPSSYPKPKIWWAVMDDSLFKPILLDERITTNYDGHLFFAHVEPDDYRNGKKYACFVQNGYLSRVAIGEHAIVIPSGNAVTARAVGLRWAKSTNVIALRGTKQNLKCVFSGKPTPTVKWQRKNGAMPDHELLSANMELSIKSVKFEDAGDYECIGRNTETPNDGLRNGFKLSVHSRPYFIEEPKDRTSAPNETVSFRCVAGGFPSPQVDWFINGKHITDPTLKMSPRLNRVGVNELRFEHVKIADDTAIQCNASNIHGYAFADVYLNVISEPPSFTTKPASTKIAASQKSYTLSCRVRGAPVPLIWWEKDGTDITGGGKYTFHSNGDLQLKWVQSTDAGIYTCLAKNKFETIKTSATLVVRERTRILERPKGMATGKGAQAKFICTATTDPDELNNLKITWKKDGDTISSGIKRVYNNLRDRSLHISNLIQIDSGSYTCVASNGLDSDSAKATLIVIANPESPFNIMVTQCGLSAASVPTASITWGTGADNNVPILGFYVEYNTTFHPDVWTRVPREIARSGSSATIILSPWANYTFRVISKNYVGPSKPSLASSVCAITSQTSPSLNPVDVRTEDKGPGKLHIKWAPLPAEDHNGGNFFYEVSYKRLDVDNAKVKIVKLIRFRDHLEPMFEVEPNDGIYKPYMIQIQSGNTVGYSTTQPVTFIGFSGEAGPAVAPTGFTLVGVPKANDVTFSWDAINPVSELINGWLTGYVIEFWLDGHEFPKRYHKILLPERSREQEIKPWLAKLGRKKRAASEERSKRQTNSTIMAVLTQLPSYTKISAQVRILNRNYAGPPSKRLVFQTQQGIPGPVSDLKVLSLGSNYMTLQWKLPSHPNSLIGGYNIYYAQVAVSADGRYELGKKQPRRPQIDVLPGQTGVIKSRLAGLGSSTRYRIYVYAVSAKATEGEENFIEVDMKKISVPGIPKFKITNVTLTTFNVTWIPNPSSPGAGFFVKYKKEGTNYWKHTAVQINLHWYNITNLEPGIVYEVIVVAYNGELYQRQSLTQSVEMLGDSPISSIGSSGWFLGLLVTLVLMIIGLAVICCVKRQRLDMHFNKYEEEPFWPDGTQDSMYDETSGDTSKTSRSERSQVTKRSTSSIDKEADIDTDVDKNDGSISFDHGIQREPVPDVDATVANTGPFSTFV